MPEPLARLVHHIRPRLVRCGREPVRLIGSPIDTHSLGAGWLRAILLFGEPVGGVLLDIEWGIWHGADLDGKFRAFLSTRGAVMDGTATAQGVAWLRMPIGPEAGHKRYLRGGITLSGDVQVIAGMILEFFTERPGWMPDSGPLGGEIETPSDDLLPGV